MDPKDPAPEEDLRVACAKIISAAQLRGTLLGVSMVFLKYYHADTLMAMIEHQHAAATKLCTAVRVVLAKRYLQKLKAERERAIQAAKEKAEREARERARQEQIERERAAAAEAERKAKEAAEAMAAKLEQQRRETLQRKRAQEEQKAAQAAVEKAQAEARAAREAAEKLEQEVAAERARVAAEEDELKRKQEAAAAAEEEEKVQRRKKAADEFSKAQREAKLNNRMSAFDLVSGVDLTPGGQDLANKMAPAPEAEIDEEDAFSELFSDEGIDLAHRERLAALAAKRRAEEVRRRQALKALHAEEEQRKAAERMRELNEIAEQERKLKEEREAAAEIDAAGTEARLAEMDFGDFAFSFGGPSVSEPKTEAAPPPTPAPKPEPAAPAPAKKPPPPVAERSRKSFLGSVFNRKGSAGSRSGSIGRKGSKAKNRDSVASPLSSPTKPESTEDAESISPALTKPAPEARKFSTASKRKKQPPPEPSLIETVPPEESREKPPTLPKPAEPVLPPATSSPPPQRSLSKATKTKNKKPLPTPDAALVSSLKDVVPSMPEGDQIKCTLTKSEAGSFGIGISSIPGTGNIKVSSLESRHGATGLCIGDVIIEVNGTPVVGSGHLVILGLIKQTIGALTLVVVRKRSASLRSVSAQEPVQATPPQNEPSPIQPKQPILAAAPTPTPAAAPTPTAPGEPRRRKLVRGGNAKPTAVLPEYAAALQAIDDLDKFLDEFESADKQLAAETEVVTGSISRTGTIRKRDSVGDSRRIATSPEGVQALENVLLLGSKEKEQTLERNESISQDLKSKFVEAATTLQSATPEASRRGTRTRKNTARQGSTDVDIKGYSLNAADILSMDENERIALLERVKSGKMSIDDALQEVIEHKRRQNCIIM